MNYLEQISLPRENIQKGGEVKKCEKADAIYGQPHRLMKNIEFEIKKEKQRIVIALTHA